LAALLLIALQAVGQEQQQTLLVVMISVDGMQPDCVTFFLVGSGVPQAHSLGIIDMRDIAPTLAHLAGLSLPSAEGKNLLP
jgi:Ran GTPase-activating protein (RanGAP) involved in mRNA processing and transport